MALIFAARDHGLGDDEDTLVVSLAQDPAVDALVIVTSDHLLELGRLARPDHHAPVRVRPARAQSVT